MPPATSRQPATARVTGAPRMNDPATAASGRTVTAAAAASGSTLQPLISNRTSRNTTAVSAPDSRVSAIAASTSLGGRGRCSRTVAIGVASSAGAAASAIGACTRKIARQSNASVRMPPSAGPAAVPGHRRAEPQAASAAAAVERVERGREQRRRPDRLERAHQEQELERVGGRAPERRGGEQQRAGGAGGPPVQSRAQRQADRQHSGVDGDHRGHSLDRRVQLEQQRRQRQYDHGRIGERKAGRDRDQCALHQGLCSGRGDGNGADIRTTQIEQALFWLATRPPRLRP